MIKRYPRQNRFDADGVLRNIVTSLATARASSNNNAFGQRIKLSRAQLDVLEQHGLIRRLNGELPADASGKPTVTTGTDHNEALQQCLRDLQARQRIRKAMTVARGYGGAALWVTFDGGGAPDTPLDESKIERVRNLVVINRFELTPQWSNADDKNSATGLLGYENDPRKQNYLEPTSYLYVPAEGGSTETIHASRLIRFYGNEVPDHLRTLYDGWGAPVIESTLRTYAQLYMAKEGGAEALAEVGHMVYQLDNLQAILSGSKRSDLNGWMELQADARSAINGTILGAGQDARRMDAGLNGWSDVYDRIAQMWAAENEYPITKLYGQAPGGLSTDDASAWRNWEARVESQQSDVIIPAYEQILGFVCLASDGPTKGKVPPKIEVSLTPYQVPTHKEEAETANVLADALTKLASIGAVDEDDARETIRSINILRLIEPDAEAKAWPQGLEQDLAKLLNAGAPDGEQVGAPAEAGGAAPAPATKPQDSALNGAQAIALKDIVAAVYAGEIPRQSAIRSIQRAYLVSQEQAAAIVGPGLPDASEALGEPQTRADAKDPVPLDETRKPPQAVADNANRALEVRAQKPESQRGMTATGLARARDLGNRRPITIEVMREMWAWFKRHAVDKQGSTWSEQGKGWQGWNGWGGDEGQDWVTAELKAVGHLVRQGDGWGLIHVDDLREARADALRVDPYSGPNDKALPDAVRRLKGVQRATWVKVFNAVLDDTGSEQQAFAAAYGALMRDEAGLRADTFDLMRHAIECGPLADPYKVQALERARQAWRFDDVQGTEASEPADPGEQIEGSSQNPSGSASGTRGGIEIADDVVKALERKADEHNDRYSAKGKEVDLGMLKAVWRRGAGAYSTSHDPDMSRAAWAMARVNAFLELVAEGKPSNARYTTDFDLLPAGHPKKRETKSDYGPTSMMLALKPPAGWSDAWQDISDVPTDEHHVTLIYFDHIDDEHAAKIVEVAAGIAQDTEPLRLRTSGPGLFPNGSGYARVLLMSGMGLNAFRARLANAVRGAGLMTPQTHDFVAHLTLGYHEPDTPPAGEVLTEMATRTAGEFEAPELWAVRDGEWWPIPFAKRID